MEQRQRHLHLVDDAQESAATSTFSRRPAFNERRFHGQDAAVRRVVCRVCYARPTVAAEYLDLVEGRVTFRCPLCGGSSLVRWDDWTATGTDQGSTGR